MKKFYVLSIALMAMNLSMTLSAKQLVTRKTAKKTTTELSKPVAKPATDVTEKGFTAHWEKVEGAEGYAVMVYNKTKIEKDGEYKVLDEDFSGITEGSLIEPLGGDEEYVNLDDYSFGDNAGWSAYAFPNFVPSMVAGLLYSPYLNLTNNDGKYKVAITTYSTDGDQILVVSHGKGEKVTKQYTVSIENGGAGLFTQELEFDNGSEDLFFTIINNTSEVATTDYTDRVQVFQDLKKGDEYYKLVAIDESIPAYNDAEIPITSKLFSDVTTYADGSSTLYYRVSAGAYNFYYDENNQMQYNYKQSPYSDYIQVDLKKNTDDSNNDKPNEGEQTEKPGNTEGNKLTLGHFLETADMDDPQNNPIAYDGNNWYNAPMTFAYKYSGSQNLYMPEELADLKDKDITSISFSCFGELAYYTSDYHSTAKIFIKEVDDEEFNKNAGTGDLEWFSLDNESANATAELNLNFMNSTINNEDIVITFDLSKNPFHYTGKTLLLTISNESDQTVDMSELVRFNWMDRKKNENTRSCVFANDDIDFMEDLSANNRISALDSHEGQNDHVPAVQFTYSSGTTAITNLLTNNHATSDDAWYTLQGVRIQKPTKGIYIHHGQKIVLK